MNNKNIYKAVSGIDEAFLAGAENTDMIRKSFRKAKTKKTALFFSCFLAVVIIALSVLPFSNAKRFPLSS